MKQIKITKKFVGWEDECKKCGKVIQGTTTNQLKHNMKIHTNSKRCKIRQEKE